MSDLSNLYDISQRLNDPDLDAVSEELDALMAGHERAHRQYVPEDCYLCAYQRGEQLELEGDN